MTKINILNIGPRQSPGVGSVLGWFSGAKAGRYRHYRRLKLGPARTQVSVEVNQHDTQAPQAKCFFRTLIIHAKLVYLHGPYRRRTDSIPKRSGVPDRTFSKRSGSGPRRTAPACAGPDLA